MADTDTYHSLSDDYKTSLTYSPIEEQIRDKLFMGKDLQIGSGVDGEIAEWPNHEWYEYPSGFGWEGIPYGDNPASTQTGSKIAVPQRRRPL